MRRPKSRRSIIVVAVLGIAVLRTPVPVGSTSNVPDGAPTAEQLAGATFAGILDESITLRGGVYEGAPFVEGGASRPRVWLAPLRADADLTGDAVPEAVVLLSSSQGGSGTQVHVAVVGMVADGARSLGSALLGDRVQVRALAVRDGRIEIDVVEPGPDDAACCPGQLARRSWAWHGDTLREVKHEIGPKLSTAVLRDTRWTLVRFDRDEPLPANVEVTLAFEDGRAFGSSGCNRYTVAVEPAASPTDDAATLRFGPAAGTRRLCGAPLDDAETLYLKRLAQVTRFTFLMGQLALTWSDDGRSGFLLFDAR